MSNDVNFCIDQLKEKLSDVESLNSVLKLQARIEALEYRLNEITGAIISSGCLDRLEWREKNTILDLLS